MSEAPFRVACIVAHPDDEVLLAGGALFGHAQKGASVRSLILASGLDSRGDADSAAHAVLADSARSAAAILGCADPELAGLPDNQLDSVPLLRLVQKIERFLADFPAEIIYTHHRGDLNVDHRLVHDAVVTATRPVPGSHASAPRILAGEVLSSSEWQSPQMAPFQPQYFVVLDRASLAAKIDALRAYKGEIRKAPHPRSAEGVETLAKLRGMTCGHAAAEAFMLIREIVR